MFVHVIPAQHMANPHYGTYKDVVTRVDWLKARFRHYEQVLIERDDPHLLAPLLDAARPLEGALIEYSYQPRIVKALKTRYPAAIVAVRAINVEPWQHLDNYGWWPARGPIWMLYGMFRLTALDIQSKRYADHLCCINDWELRRYWKWLPGRAKLHWLPYRCPDHMLPRHSIPYRDRNVIACVPTSQKNRKSWDLVTRFHAFASDMRRQGSNDQFVVTGNLADWELPPCDAVTYTGFVEDLASFLGACKAVALLSPLGYGFKTTMGDALAAGAHVITHADLIRKSPATISSYAIPFKPGPHESVTSVMQQLEQPPDGVKYQEECTRRIETEMREMFGDLKEVG